MDLFGDLQLRSRKLDYLQLQWLEKTTGQSAANWDIYVLKELIDNALDADEAARIESINIKVSARYARHQERDLFSLEIDVANTAIFPLTHIEQIFDFDIYASSKSGINIPSRGKQGNALKTIIGIPYALRHFHYGDYEAVRRPIVIENRQGRHTISVEIDEEINVIKLCHKKDNFTTIEDGHNWIRVGIDRFIQKSPREIEELFDISCAIALFNPHVNFDWMIVVGEEKKEWSFRGSKDWPGKFSGSVPVSWYDKGQLRPLLMSLLPSPPLDKSIEEIIGFFPGFDAHGIQELCKRVPTNSLRELLRSSDLVDSFYQDLISAEQSIPDAVSVDDLGRLGRESMERNIEAFFGTPQQAAYKLFQIQDLLRPWCPFVLEIFGARFDEDFPRTIWTGINNTRTYGDPFSRTDLLSPNSTTHAEVRGLQEFIESFGVNRTTPFVIAIHLICPNIRYQDFSKTLIDGTPFREKLEEGLATVLEELKRGEVEARTAREAVKRELLKQLIPQAVKHLSSNGRHFFSLEQLVQNVGQLYQNKIESAGSETSLVIRETHDAVNEYNRKYPEKLANLIRKSQMSIYLPGVDMAVAWESINSRSLAEVFVNKVLVLNNRELVEVFVANDLLRRFDMAVLTINATSLLYGKENLRVISNWKVPLLLAHDATVSGCALSRQFQEYLKRNEIVLSVYDLGLKAGQGAALGLQPVSVKLNDSDKNQNLDLSVWERKFLFEDKKAFNLLSLSPKLLKEWLQSELQNLGLSEKMELTGSTSRVAAFEAFVKYIKEWVAREFRSQLNVDSVVDSVVKNLLAHYEIEDFLEQIRFDSENKKNSSWKELLEEVVTSEIPKLILQNEEELQYLIRIKSKIS